MRIKHFFSGQSLFEVVIAVSAAALLTIALVSLGTRSLGTSMSSKNQSAASSHVAEATEWLRSQRDAGWEYFVTNAASCSGGVRCLISFRTGIWDYECGHCPEDRGILLDNLYSREISFNCFGVTNTADLAGSPVANCSPADSVNKVDATVSVLWSDSKGEHNASANTSYTSWQGGVIFPTMVPCGPGNCGGCCLFGSCKPGTSINACGSSGVPCAVCSGVQVCYARVCVNPTPTPVPGCTAQIGDDCEYATCCVGTCCDNGFSYTCQYSCP